MPLMGFASPLGGTPSGGGPRPGPVLSLAKFASADATVDFGSDILVFPDLDDTLELSTGIPVLLDAVARRFITPEQRLADYPEYGIDLRQYLSAAMTSTKLRQLEQLAQDEAEQDERVDTATAAATYLPDEQRVVMKVALQTAQGPFTLTLSVSQLTVDLLSEP